MTMLNSDNFERISTIYKLMKVKGVGPVRTNKILYSLAGDLDENEFHDKINSVLDSSQLEYFRHSDNVIDEMDVGYPVGFMSIIDEFYPDELKRFLSVNTPPVLSYIGNVGLLTKRKAAFSGSRKVSEKGIGITRDCVKQMSAMDVAIVSGYAAGVDVAAHEEAIASGGSTIVILPEGIKNFRIKKELKNIWDWNRVLVISEFMPDDKWTVGRAMSRNNTIIGLSDIVFVIEAGNTGGSLDAGFKTLEKGKPLFVPQYGIVPESASGNNMLISRGAYPVRMKRETARANLYKAFEFFKSRPPKELF